MVARSKWKIVTSAVLLVAIASAVFLWNTRRARALGERDLILVTDFTNTTGDAVFDGTLKTALQVSLAQSPFLNLVPQQDVASLKKWIERGKQRAVALSEGKATWAERPLLPQAADLTRPAPGSTYALSTGRVLR